MKETYKFLKENTQVNFVPTIKDGMSSCRPSGDPIMYDDKIYVISNKNKNVSIVFKLYVIISSLYMAKIECK